MNKEQAIKKKAEWLAYCLKVGWSKDDLDELSNIWDRFRDEEGNLKPKAESISPSPSLTLGLLISAAIGNCLKHPGQNFVNCPLCEIEKAKPQQYYAVEYAGYFMIQREPFYGGKDLLNAEDVGYDEAKKTAELIVKLLNNQP